jgi:hypothetical protein
LVYDGLRVAKPKVSLVLDKNAQLLVYQWFKSLYFPDGYASNILRLVNLKDNKLYEIKSHNCHVFIQTLITLVYRDLLPEGIWGALLKKNIFLEIYALKIYIPNT